MNRLHSTSYRYFQIRYMPLRGAQHAPLDTQKKMPVILCRCSLAFHPSRERHHSMSIRQMYAVWKIKDLDIYEGMLLLALADYASDDGTRIFPSMSTLVEKSRMSERKVRSTLRLLEGKGHMKTILGSGRTHSQYTLTLPSELLAEYDAKCKKKHVFTLKKADERIDENFLDQF